MASQELIGRNGLVIGLHPSDANADRFRWRNLAAVLGIGLFVSRWREGFRCPHFTNGRRGSIAAQLLRERTASHRQTSVITGTLPHRTHLPLQLWFWVAYLTTTATLGIGRYQTEWVVLRKLRRVMVNLEAFPADRGGVPLAKLAEDNTRNYSTGHRFPTTTQLGNAG